MKPIDLGGRKAINIVKVSYRSGVNGRVARAFVKVPYGAMFDLGEKLARGLAKGQVMWYRLDIAKPDEIAEHRSTFTRWPEALRDTSALTRVDWQV